jgi:dihydroneopterin aldolase/2-amino-4-hydroxy-6-hydroxymethyldihydropteridine diphosphokinase
MGDKIFIDDLEVFARHGVYAEEKFTPQRFLLSICAEFDGAVAKISDEISHTIDYSKLMDTVMDAAKNSSFNLIERLSKHIADAVLAKFQAIVRLSVTVKKFPDSMASEKFSVIGFSSTFSRDEK